MDTVPDTRNEFLGLASFQVVRDNRVGKSKAS
jgi:hypothetical protein